MNKVVEAGDQVIEDHLGGVQEDFLRSETGGAGFKQCE
jgi:hypothetical protein